MSSHGTKRRHRRYPDEWFDGGVWCLELDRDVSADPRSARRALQMAARNRGLRVRIAERPQESPPCIYMQVTTSL